MVRRRASSDKVSGAAHLEPGAEKRLLDPVFQNLVLQSPISTWIADRNGTNIFENAACREMFGIERDDQVVGKYNLFEDDVLKEQGVIPQIRKPFEEGVPVEVMVDYDFSKVRHVNVPGATHRFLRGFLFPIKDASGNVQYVVVQHEDYTAKHEVDEALKKERDRAQQYLDVVGTIVVAVGADQKVTLINLRGSEVLGYEESEILGKNWFDTFVPESTRERARDIFLKWIAGDVESVEDFENPILTRSGEERIIAWHNTVLRDQENRIYATLSSGEDITERKRTEEALQIFRYAVDSSADGICITDADGNAIYVNAACAKMHGYTQDELLGQDLSCLYDDPTAISQILPIVVRTGGWRGDTIGRRKEGSTFVKELRISPVRLPGQECPAILSVCRDVTVEKQADESRRRMEAYFEEQQRKFYKQTILAATGGKLAIYEHEEMDRFRKGAIAVYPIRTAEAASLARHRIRESAIAAGMPVARADNLALCVGEAATNALKHAGGGEIALIIRDDRVFVRVSDRGPGMDALILPRATLELGYSTGKSLGMGYAVILALADHVFLDTSPAGTTVVIEIQMKVRDQTPSVEALPDMW